MSLGEAQKVFEEELDQGLKYTYGFKKILDSTRSKWQQVDVIDTVPFGKCLIIDGLMQSSELDEYVYHECLVHPAMLSHPNPKTVFIGGGGEGSTAREVLRHKTVEKCVMVDIDGDVVDFCKKALTENKEAFADPRLELIIDDAKARLENSPIKFDVIILDLDDPLEGGPCYQLYTKQFYEMAKKQLNPGGIVVTQSSGGGMKHHKLVFSPVHNTFKQVFPSVYPYATAVYSFADQWSWVLGFSEASEKLSSEEIDKRAAERINGTLKFLDGVSYTGVFCLSKAVRKTMAEEDKVLSVDGTFSLFYGSGVHEKGQK
eukprot:TRINITY_DN76724_c0_g1_i1.p1 TRINITY_DN76724_c0_g1~~TRINITY_DN76724_c0_g1_i1.p1  ORF type:complete len:316 (+),score=45.34 TRINITY_DN76724_c0_g1_i1:44-991(+)